MSVDRKEIEERLIPGLRREGIHDITVHEDLSGYINEIEVNDPAFKVPSLPPIAFAEKARTLVNKPAEIALLGMADAMPGMVDSLLPEKGATHRVIPGQGQAVCVSLSERMVDSLLDAYLQAKYQQDSPSRIHVQEANTGHLMVPQVFDREAYDETVFKVGSDGVFYAEAEKQRNGLWSRIQFPAINMKDLANLKKEIMKDPSGQFYSMGFASKEGLAIKTARIFMASGNCPMPTDDTKIGWISSSDQKFISKDAEGDERYILDHTGATFKLQNGSLELPRGGVDFKL